MYESDFIRSYKQLPDHLKQEISDFVEFVISKYRNSLHEKNTSQKPDKRKFGVFPKGTFEMTEDFNAPLDVFKDYMKL